MSTCNVSGSVFEGNAYIAFVVDSANVSIWDSVFLSNVGDANHGGAISLSGSGFAPAVLYVERTKFISNSAGRGGAMTADQARRPSTTLRESR